MRNTFIKTLYELAKDDDSIYVVAGDAGFGVFEAFRGTWPNRFINSGIAEANMIGYSAGMAMAGFNVFVYNIIPFLLYRCYEQVKNDICYQHLPVTLIGTGAGLTYAPGGMTHYSVEDLGICATLPNLTVISPIDPVETAAAVRYATASESPVYIRLAKSGEPVIRQDMCADILKPAVIREGEDVVLLSYGTVFEEAIVAAEELKKLGVNLGLVSVPTLNPFPRDEIIELIKDFSLVITLEEQFSSTGLGMKITDLFVQEQINAVLVKLALPVCFIHKVNNQTGMRKYYGIDSKAVISATMENINNSVKAG